jgi:hypothetical protein
VVARSITDPGAQAVALADVARALAKAGQHEQAGAVAIRAEAVARSITDPYWYAVALADVARALAKAGQHERGGVVAVRSEAAARSITNPYRQARALAQAVRALAGAGQYERAESVARSITDPEEQADAFAELAIRHSQIGASSFAFRIAAALCSVAEWSVAACIVLSLDQDAFTSLSRTLGLE